MDGIVRLEELLALRPSPIFFECVSGSRAYGTATATSDEDIRGIFAVSAATYLDLVTPPDQINDGKGDIVYYSLRRTIELLSQANPNLLELLFMPDDCVRKSSASMQRLMAQRHLFVTRQCADTHINYAMSQIKKARGQNKWVNHPKPLEPLAEGLLLRHIPGVAMRVRTRRRHAPFHCDPQVGHWMSFMLHAWSTVAIFSDSIGMGQGPAGFSAAECWCWNPFPSRTRPAVLRVSSSITNRPGARHW